MRVGGSTCVDQERFMTHASLIVACERSVAEELPHPCVSEYVECSVRVRNGMRRVH